MSHVVSFYVTRPESDDEGRRSTLWYRLGSRSWIGVFAAAGLEPGLVRRIRDGDSREAHDRLWEAIESGGGVFVKVREEAGADEIEIYQNPGSGFEPPSRALVLRWGRPAEVVPIPWGEMLQVDSGDHVMIPVEGVAEAGLRRFHGSLAGFPPDVRTNLLEVLRRPALEARIAHLEAGLREIAERQVSSAPRQSVRQPVLAASAAVIGLVIGLSLAAGGFDVPWTVRLPPSATPTSMSDLTEVPPPRTSSPDPDTSAVSEDSEGFASPSSGNGDFAAPPTREPAAEPAPLQDPAAAEWTDAWASFLAAARGAEGPRWSALAETHLADASPEGPEEPAHFWAVLKAALLVEGRGLRLQVFSEPAYWSAGWTEILTELGDGSDRSRALAALGCRVFTVPGARFRPDDGRPFEDRALDDRVSCEAPDPADLALLRDALERWAGAAGASSDEG